MDWGAIFFVLTLVVMAILFLSQPFLDRDTKSSPLIEGQGVDDSRKMRELWRLEERRDQLLSALQDLDYDHEMGKIPPEDYESQREGLLVSGVEVIRQIRAIRPVRANLEEQASSAVMGVVNGGLQRARKYPSFEEDELEEMIKTYRRTRQEKAIGFCPRCRKAIKESDRFCAQCGAPVEKDKLLKNL